jgi:hypothetical protein
MAAVHETWVAEMFGALARDEQEQLLAILAKLKSSLVAQQIAKSAQ